jgi:DtxR family transcriptional regulator, Mn-dependent transcriptional regulator
MPTATLEEYLEAIYRLSADQELVRPSRIAEAMGVSGPTVTATLRRLEAQGFVRREGTAVVLTPSGLEKSVDIVRRHRISESFLVDTLGMDWDVAHEEACLLEHALSPRVLEALERFLDNPASCPHGHPIPGADGSVSDGEAGRPLCDVGAGERAQVLRVSENDERLLGYLGSLGLRPGKEVTVVGVGPFGGPLTIEIAGVQTAIAHEVAALVTVTGD